MSDFDTRRGVVSPEICEREREERPRGERGERYGDFYDL
jgi:hypothetical protein